MKPKTYLKIKTKIALMFSQKTPFSSKNELTLYYGRKKLTEPLVGKYYGCGVSHSVDKEKTIKIKYYILYKLYSYFFLFYLVC